MPNGLTLRPATSGDVEAVRDLHARSFAGLARTHHSKREIAAHVELIRSAAYGDELLAANLAVAVDENDRILATAGWQAMPDRPGTARIRKVFVDPDLARKGLGTFMVTDAEARARRCGFDRFYVRANINAVPLYRKLGYREIGLGEMAVGDGVALPVVFMEKAGQDTEA